MSSSWKGRGSLFGYVHRFLADLDILTLKFKKTNFSDPIDGGRNESELDVKMRLLVLKEVFSCTKLAVRASFFGLWMELLDNGND